MTKTMICEIVLMFSSVLIFWSLWKWFEKLRWFNTNIGLWVCFILGVLGMLFSLTYVQSPTHPNISSKLAPSGYQIAFVSIDRSTGVTSDLNPSLSNRRLSPCSTFKIYNTLIGLELGILKGADEPWYKWDGVVRDIEGWNKDLTLREAIRVSAVPAYQILAREIGSQRMQKYIDDLDYGTRDISAGIDTFWLDRPNQTSIKISAIEQINLLNKLLDGKLPFSKQNIDTLKDILFWTKTDKGTLYGKTGSGMDANGKWSLGWYVGFLESGNSVHVFACNITEGKEPSGKTARSIVEDLFRSRGLL